MNKLQQTVLGISTCAASVVVLCACIPIAPALVMMTTITAHEAGHAVMGSLSGAETSMPIFVPLGFFVVGLTRIKNISEEFKQAVAIAGPMSGAAAALGLLLLSLWIGNAALTTAAVTALAYEVWSGTLGSDGRRYRIAKRG